MLNKVITAELRSSNLADKTQKHKLETIIKAAEKQKLEKAEKEPKDDKEI